MKPLQTVRKKVASELRTRRLLRDELAKSALQGLLALGWPIPKAAVVCYVAADLVLAARHVRADSAVVRELNRPGVPFAEEIAQLVDDAIARLGVTSERSKR